MTDPAVKAAVGMCVLMAGVCAAMLFRRDQSMPAVPEATNVEQLLLRFRAEARAACEQTLASGRAAADGPQPAAVESRPATVVMPSDRREPPPSLSPEYPARSSPGASQDAMPPAAQTARTHTVVDGDTLQGLAERYLGSAARAVEIYQANRDKLSNPNLLPIGVELKLPPRT
jgi:nucleoid-associated protein YgaU